VETGADRQDELLAHLGREEDVGRIHVEPGGDLFHDGPQDESKILARPRRDGDAADGRHSLGQLARRLAVTRMLERSATWSATGCIHATSSSLRGWV